MVSEPTWQVQSQAGFVPCVGDGPILLAWLLCLWGPRWEGTPTTSLFLLAVAGVVYL
jgi:hypothetical protein